jgi:molybdate transport system permease protein
MSGSLLRQSLPSQKALGRVTGAPLRRAVSSMLWTAPSALLLLFIVLPLVALVWRALDSPAFVPSLAKPAVLQAVRLTVLTTAATLLISIAVGTPLAYLLARRTFPAKWLVQLLVDLPLVVPPVVAGVALLMAFGRRGLLGAQLSILGIEIPFTTTAVVLAQLFLAAPLYVRSAQVGFAAVDPALEEAAAIDGASPWQTFWYVLLPLALPGLAGGAVLCLTRAASEFGATLMFAGSFAGRTQTMSLAIMAAFETDLSAALALAVLLLGLSTAALVLVHTLAGRQLDR